MGIWKPHPNLRRTFREPTLLPNSTGHQRSHAWTNGGHPRATDNLNRRTGHPRSLIGTKGRASPEPQLERIHSLDDETQTCQTSHSRDSFAILFLRCLLLLLLDWVGFFFFSCMMGLCGGVAQSSHKAQTPQSRSLNTLLSSLKNSCPMP